MKVEIEISEECEGTSSPWWSIINPSQNFKTNEEGIYAIASMITGPFFSREEATRELKNRRYDYSEHAVVFCHSGYHSGQYSQKVRF